MMNLLKQKKIEVLCLISALSIGIATTIYYKKICSSGICSYQSIVNVITPIESGAYIVSCFFLVFLFLPSHYFKTWFKYIFSWAFPLSVYLIYITTGSHSVPAYGKDDVVRFWGMFYGIVTALFILYIFIKSRHQK